MSFSYPPLPANDGLRILTLEPGGFWDPFEGALTSIPFSDKPRYLALSYTWADPTPEHARLPAMPPPAPTAKSPKPKVPGTPDEPDLPEWTAKGLQLPESSTESLRSTEEPYIVLNGQRLSLFHNVALALRFLRSRTHSLALWVDAICIDQASIPERNAQVALMAFIFTRALAVVSWLGVPRAITALVNKKKRDTQTVSLAMMMAYERGDSHKLAARLAPPFVRRTQDHLDPLGCFTAPEYATGESGHQEISESEHIPSLHNIYWERLWVVQEVCLPRSLYFVHGGQLYTEAMIREARRTPAMNLLLGARDGRFTDTMRLEALIERFMNSGCAEARDRVFGLVGLANDVDSFALEVGVAEPSVPEVVPAASQSRLALLERLVSAPPPRAEAKASKSQDKYYYIESDSDSDLSGGEAKTQRKRGRTLNLSTTTGLRSAVGGLFKAPSLAVVDPRTSLDRRRGAERPSASSKPSYQGRGRGRLEINYQRSLYDIWCDVVAYMHFRAKPLDTFGETMSDKEDERRIRVVRFAGVLQRALNYRVEQELQESSYAPTNLLGTIIAKGYVAGTILHLGPTYGDFVGSYHGQQRWLGSWDTHYHKPEDLEKLRLMEEQYAHKILDFTDRDLGRICYHSSPRTRAWSALSLSPPYPLSRGPAVDFELGQLSDGSGGKQQTGERPHELLRFLGTEFCMGLVPTAAQVGDLIIRFWNCDAAIVVRQTPSRPNWDSNLPDPMLYKMVGRADVAEPWQRVSGSDHAAVEAMRVIESAKGTGGVLEKTTRGMYVEMDFDTLQKVSASIEI